MNIVIDDILNKKKQLFANYLHFHEDLLKVQVRNMQRLIAVIPFQKLNKINIEDKLNSNEFLITSDYFLVQEKELDNIFEEILPILKKYTKKKELKQLEDLYDKHKIHLKDLIKYFIQKKEKDFKKLCEEFNFSTSFLTNISKYISSPYLELCSEYFIKKIENKWNEPICPICGSLPSMASVSTGTNNRLLWCQLCATEWRYNGISCPYCQNNNMDELKYIFPPDNTSYRIDACDNCQRYIKTIDTYFSTEATNFTVEYLATYYLDVIAIGKGYKL